MMTSHAGSTSPGPYYWPLHKKPKQIRVEGILNEPQARV